ncbi:MAG: ribbon-helix-helix protein, CopG family [Paludisphaera borealis]|uniref:ribbon-helix-helix protein, CopG family n=1 Tax=Paludisphaera borealis TaxID=1387353 RepID=UPI00284C3649|nr:ribbon-helix-helix protein, CopG family [Paludisphaera borealis]MDR3622653.1 ribbon-helix-helix protein, CopG family [Paludisphaera borealis]
MDRISFRVEPGLKQQLEAEAKAEGVSPSDLAREALREHLRRRKPRETAYDVAKRLGIIGVYTDAPSDLSTNPDHMEGFGARG